MKRRTNERYKHKSVRALEHLFKELPKDRQLYYSVQKYVAFLLSLLLNFFLGVGAFFFVKDVIGREGDALYSALPLIIVLSLFGAFAMGAFCFRRIDNALRQEHVTLTGDDLELVPKARSGNPVSF